MRSPIRLYIVLVAMVVFIAGCSSKEDKACATDVEYLASGSIEELKVPADLDDPEGRERLVIPPQIAPPEVDPDKAASAARPCLARPPDYFGD